MSTIYSIRSNNGFILCVRSVVRPFLWCVFLMLPFGISKSYAHLISDLLLKETFQLSQTINIVMRQYEPKQYQSEKIDKADKVDKKVEDKAEFTSSD